MTSWQFVVSRKRPSEDGYVLANLVKKHSKKRPAKALDAGCGDGLIVNILAEDSLERSKWLAIDISSLAAEAARSNLARFKNVSVECISFQKFSKRKKEKRSFDLIVINPPYYGIERGRRSSRIEDALSRQEGSLRVKEWVRGVFMLLKPGGFLWCCFRMERLPEILSEQIKQNIQPKEMWIKANSKNQKVFWLRSVCSEKPGGFQILEID